MEIYQLGATIFKPLQIIEGWDSLIWTERYRDGGEFELSTYNIDYQLAALPCGDPTAKPSLVCLGDSREVMIVESHEIDFDEQGRRMLVTKGRTFETFLEQRVFACLSNAPIQMQRGYSDYGAVVCILWNALANNTLNDVVFGNSNNETANKIPNLTITDSTDISLGNKNWWIESGYVYPKVLDFLQRNNMGIRNLRPITYAGASGFVDVVSVDSTGSITRTSTAWNTITDLCMDVYNGHIRTKDQTALPQVIFSEGQAHVVNSRYLFTIKNLKNEGYVTSAALHGFLYWDTYDGTTGTSTTWGGLKKRVLHFDGGSKWGTVTPTPGTTLYDNVVAAMTQKAEVKTKRHRKTSFYDGQISENTPYKYNVDYFLGDKVSFVGDYGVLQNVRVLEYNRIHDSQGERGYPTLMFDGTPS